MDAAVVVLPRRDSEVAGVVALPRRASADDDAGVPPPPLLFTGDTGRLVSVPGFAALPSTGDDVALPLAAMASERRERRQPAPASAPAVNDDDDDDDDGTDGDAFAPVTPGCCGAGAAAGADEGPGKNGLAAEPPASGCDRRGDGDLASVVGAPRAAVTCKTSTQTHSNCVTLPPTKMGYTMCQSQAQATGRTSSMNRAFSVTDWKMTSYRVSIEFR